MTASHEDPEKIHPAPIRPGRAGRDAGSAHQGHDLDDVLVVNGGSTSVKLTRRRDGTDTTSSDLDMALAESPGPAVIIHRVVHGGRFTGPVRLDDHVIAELRALAELAPLHQPPALEAIDRTRAAWPAATQLACFDTSFHASMPREARTYALPTRLRERVQVYGFHGLSHAWASAAVRRAAPDARRVLIAHLGGGQSLCGVLDGRSVVTTMGFTPLDGLVMATRSGAIDPGALLYLARHTDEDLDHVLERDSGLLGLSGTSDMQRVLQRRAAGDPDAVLAIDVWLHQFLRQAGGCIAVLGGLDALAFTGGIGENSADIRALIADRMAWLGVRVESGALASAPDTANDIAEVSATDAPIRVFVVHAREDLQMLYQVSTFTRQSQDDQP